MKAGGITIVATYIFWIYHEETEGEFDFEGDRDIRRFLEDAERAGLLFGRECYLVFSQQKDDFYRER